MWFWILGVCIVIGAFIVIHVAYQRRYTGLILKEQAIRRRMRSRGRYISWSDLKPRLLDGEGTLLYEPISSCGPSLVWWTKDNLMELAPKSLSKAAEHGEPPAEVLAFALKCVREYTDLETGTALLTELPLPTEKPSDDDPIRNVPSLDLLSCSSDRPMVYEGEGVNS